MKKYKVEEVKDEVGALGWKIKEWDAADQLRCSLIAQRIGCIVLEMLQANKLTLLEASRVTIAAMGAVENYIDKQRDDMYKNTLFKLNVGGDNNADDRK